MIRTEIYLGQRDAGWLKREAKSRGTSVEGIIKAIIHEACTRKRSSSRKRPAGTKKDASVNQRHPWVGICTDGPRTDASLADEYLYGGE